ncbi:unnamed protein product [Eruca vesicaria subsp. sativa]|uniref:Uncharacterized protein n=1 Tax=Eruca vesicaria subsp. sativa TaxID=29727 RepID=A0ABC8JSV9_ERUVS|nr:unnamed protein product [Eruca vesicaria subsp. sativa]
MAVPGDDVDALSDHSTIDYESDHEWVFHDMAAAVKSGDVVALDTAIDNFGGLIDEPLENNDSALHLACLYGHLPCVELLLERGANIEIKDTDDALPLHDACDGAGYLDIVEFLLSRASSPECAKRMIETMDRAGNTPLHCAASGEHVNVIRFLLSSGASPSIKNFSMETPGDLAEINSDARRILEAAVANSRIS